MTGFTQSDHFNERVAGDMDLRPVLARVTAPAFVITGELDPLGEPAACEVADALPNATLVVLPEATLSSASLKTAARGHAQF
jgi:pimeloyl-ACP methyl ester carboxylesterase